MGMERWRNRVAVITGASSGIGAATLKDLANAGVTVVGLSRRPSCISKIQLSLPTEVQKIVHAIYCDITKEEDVKKVFQWVDDSLGGVDILINCAGVIYQGCLIDAHLTTEIKNTFDVHVMGTMFCSREAFQSMKRRNFDGHIVNIVSTCGHHVPQLLDIDCNFLTSFVPSKFAVRAMGETYRQEFANAGTKIKVTSISPGMTCTPISNNFLENVDIPLLNAHDVSSAILYCLGTPSHVQIHELIIKPLGQIF